MTVKGVKISSCFESCKIEVSCDKACEKGDGEIVSVVIRRSGLNAKRVKGILSSWHAYHLFICSETKSDLIFSLTPLTLSRTLVYCTLLIPNTKFVSMEYHVSDYR